MPTRKVNFLTLTNFFYREALCDDFDNLFWSYLDIGDLARDADCISVFGKSSRFEIWANWKTLILHITPPFHPSKLLYSSPTLSLSKPHSPLIIIRWDIPTSFHPPCRNIPFIVSSNRFWWVFTKSQLISIHFPFSILWSSLSLIRVLPINYSHFPICLNNYTDIPLHFID